MRRAVIGIGILILLLGIGGYYFNQAAECFGSTGAIELSQVKEAQKGQPIAPKFKMLRIAAPGCFKGHSSDSYKDLSCGYRVGGSGQWEPAKLSVVIDSETEYVVECLIPPIPHDVPSGTKLDYYFQYSPWGRPPEKKSASIAVN